MQNLDLAKLDEQQLDEHIARVAAEVTPRAYEFAKRYAAGATIIEAARGAGLSTKGGAPYKQSAHPRVSHLVALLREQVRRAGRLTAEKAIEKFLDIHKRAYAEGDWSAATAALREAAKIAVCYPEQQLNLRVEHELLDTRGVTPEEMAALAQLNHVIRPQLAGREQVIDVVATEVARTVNDEEEGSSDEVA